MICSRRRRVQSCAAAAETQALPDAFADGGWKAGFPCPSRIFRRNGLSI